MNDSRQPQEDCLCMKYKQIFNAIIRALYHYDITQLMIDDYGEEIAKNECKEIIITDTK